MGDKVRLAYAIPASWKAIGKSKQVLHGAATSDLLEVPGLIHGLMRMLLMIMIRAINSSNQIGSIVVGVDIGATLQRLYPNHLLIKLTRTIMNASPRLNQSNKHVLTLRHQVQTALRHLLFEGELEVVEVAESVRRVRSVPKVSMN